jgi:hypothetical protein
VMRENLQKLFEDNLEGQSIRTHLEN